MDNLDRNTGPVFMGISPSNNRNKDNGDNAAYNKLINRDQYGSAIYIFNTSGCIKKIQGRPQPK